MKISNEEFILLKGGNPKAFEKLYNHFKERLYNYFLVKMNGDRELAGDLLSDTIYSALKSIHTIKNKKSIQCWLFRLARNRLMDYLRKKYRNEKKQAALINEQSDVQNDMSEDLIKKERSVALHVALDNLKPLYATVLKMKYIETKSQKDIAKLINKSPGAVEGLLFRARNALKKELQKSTDLFEEVSI